MKFIQYLKKSIVFFCLINTNAVHSTAKRGDFTSYAFQTCSQNKNGVSHEISCKCGNKLQVCKKCHPNSNGNEEKVIGFVLWDPNSKNLDPYSLPYSSLKKKTLCKKCLEENITVDIKNAVEKCKEFGCPQSNAENIVEWFQNNPEYIEYLPTEHVVLFIHNRENKPSRRIIPLSKQCPKCEKSIVPLDSEIINVSFKENVLHHHKCLKDICGCSLGRESKLVVPYPIHRCIDIEGLIKKSFPDNSTFSCKDICSIF